MFKTQIPVQEGSARSRLWQAAGPAAILTLLLAGCPAHQKSLDPGPPEIFNPSLLDRG